MTDFERYEWILNNTGVEFTTYVTKTNKDIDIQSKSITTHGSVSITFDIDGKFIGFEVSE